MDFTTCWRYNSGVYSERTIYTKYQFNRNANVWHNISIIRYKEFYWILPVLFTISEYIECLEKVCSRNDTRIYKTSYEYMNPQIEAQRIRKSWRMVPESEAAFDILM